MIAVSYEPSGRTREAIPSGALASSAMALSAIGGFACAYVAPVQLALIGPLRCLFEGELFNRRELCRSLDVGAQTEPAELVALAFGRWGRETLTRLRGAFAIALWDADRRRGMLATDHAALRPWYVQSSGASVLAATSMRALLRMLPVAPEPDPIRAISWLASLNAPGAQTFARGVERVDGDTAILLEAARATPWRWWRPVYREPLRASREQLAEQLRAALGEVVRSRTPRDEITGVILSGGFDSSAVTGVAATESAAPDQLRTYSVGFPGDPTMDESSRVRELVVDRGLHNRLLDVEPAGIMRLVLEFQRDWGVPPFGPGYLLERPLLELAATDGVCGVLDGQGGDELFGFSPYLMADRVRAGRLRTAFRLLASLPDFPGLPPRAALPHVVGEFVIRPLLASRLERRLRLRGDATRHMPSWLRPDRLELFLQSEAHLAWLRRHDGPLWWRFLADILTTRRAMLAEYIAHRARDLGLRARPPLFDVDLVELALRMPPELGYGGMNRSLARDSVAGDLPDGVRLAAKKSNLGPFYHRMLAGPDLASIRALLEPRDARIYEYVDRARMLELLARPVPLGDPGSSDWTQAVWVSMTAEVALRSLENAGFCEAFIDTHNPPARAHAETP